MSKNRNRNRYRNEAQETPEEPTEEQVAQVDEDEQQESEPEQGEVESVQDEPTPTPQVDEDAPEAPVAVDEAESEEDTSDLPPSLVMINERVLSYIENMRPGLSKAEGECAQNQVSLYRAIRNTLALKGQAFTLGMDLLIKNFREHRQGVFNERYVARDFQNLQLTAGDRLLFERLLRLLMVSADVKHKQDVSRYVDIRLVIDGIKDSETQQRVLEYYQVD